MWAWGWAGHVIRRKRHARGPPGAALAVRGRGSARQSGWRSSGPIANAQRAPLGRSSGQMGV
eukprot:1108336-Prymnesium_polylepis.3